MKNCRSTSKRGLRMWQMQEVADLLQFELDPTSAFEDEDFTSCPYCHIRPVDNAGRSCTECDDMLANCDPGSTY